MPKHHFFFLLILGAAAFNLLTPQSFCENPRQTASAGENPIETLELWGQIREQNHKFSQDRLKSDLGEFRDIDNDLCAAAAKGNREILEEMLILGADPNAVDSLGVSALSHAVIVNSPEMVTTLTDAGAAVNRTGLFGITPIMLAANTNSVEIFKLLLELGADPFIENDEGESAAAIAKRKNNTEITALIHNAPFLQMEDTNSPQPETDAAENLTGDINRIFIDAVTENDTQKALERLAHGADPNYCLTNGTTALMKASELGNRALIQRLLQKKAAINAQNDEGMTALMFAAENQHPLIAELLLEHGADPRIKNNRGQTALDIASSKSKTDALQVFNQHADKSTVV